MSNVIDVTTRSGIRPIDVDQLTSQIRSLIAVEPNDEPVVSCYLACTTHAEASQVFEQRARTLLGVGGVVVDEAIERIRSYLATELHASTRGVVVFARGGARPVFVPMQFQVPLPDHVSAGATPDIYHLIELKDTYHRYVVLIASERRARILEVNLGAVTREAWTKRPELRERVGREWTHEHYQDHQRDRGQRFVDEKIRMLEKLIAASEHTHLILAGNAQLTARIRNQLPAHLRAKLVDSLSMAATASTKDVVETTLATFIEAEQQESQDAVTQLVTALWRDGLAVAGTQRTLDALRRGQADVLIVASEYPPGPAWICTACEWVDTLSGTPEECSACTSKELQRADRKELMVRIAERRGVEVETVKGSDTLMRVGGVGCLLRYAMDPSWEPSNGLS